MDLWLIFGAEIGDRVEQDEEIATIETDKVRLSIEHRPLRAYSYVVYGMA